MQQLHSTGDMIADRRFDYGRAALEEKDFRAAADLFAQVIELQPEWPTAWFHLGEAQRQNGQPAEAEAAYRRALVLDPEDRLGAALGLALLGAIAVDNAMSEGYVAQLFDDYAPRFERHLVGNLSYCGPELLAEALRAGCANAGRPYRFDHAIDLGCGTGLIAKALAKQVARFSGVDLSEKMLAKARKTGLYDRLLRADMARFLAAEPEQAADLIIAADAFVYLGPLDRVLAEARRVLKKRALLGFTLQAMQGEGYRLGEELRFWHAEAYVRQAVEQAGLQMNWFDPAPARSNLGAPVPGFVIVAERC